MKQAPLEKVNAPRQWSVSKPWNAMSLAAEALARKKAPETTVELSNVKVPLRFINAMPRHGLLTDSQAERKDETAISEALLAITESRLYGRVTARRYA
jgi:hypothetical protein